MLAQAVADHAAQIGGREVLFLQRHIVAVLQGGNDGGVGRGTADAEFFQFADQRGFGEARGGLGELLLLGQAVELERLALGEGGQLHAFLVLALGHGGEEAGEEHAFALGAPLRRAVVDGHGGVVEAGRRHLGGHETRPDEPVDLILIRGEEGFGVLGGQGHVDGADGFMGVLRVGFGLEVPLAAGREVVLAETVFDERGGGLLRFVRDAHGVGTHVGDEGHGAAIPEFQTFVQTLGDVHGTLGGVAETLVGGLLERRGDERRHGCAAAFLFLNGADRERRALHGLFQRVGGGRVGDDGLFAFDFPEFGLERRGDRAFEDGLEQPVLLGHERLPFLLAFHDEAQGHGLDASGGDAALDVLPE